GSKTVDSELQSQIEQLRDTQRKYANVLRLAQSLSTHFYHVVQTQHALAESFSDLAHKSPELQEEFLYNSETQRNLGKNGDTLLGALNFFVSCLNTLCNKTVEDTLLTVKLYENARLEFDAYRSDMEEMIQSTRGDAASSKLEEAKRNFSSHKEKYEKLRSDVIVKMKFLEENKVCDSLHIYNNIRSDMIVKMKFLEENKVYDSLNIYNNIRSDVIVKMKFLEENK
ncbi:arfaptin-2-like, partial [Limulus polyphemus]|uniref:Arfaptin-2-like n=1 Tax=Limulus polyphemus TaxID=6850 RepID=A0ABM1C2V1_LIMPO